MTSTKRLIAVSDIHAPYHDQQAVDLTQAVIERFKPHTLVFNGDVIDAYPLSGFNKNPATLKNGGLQDELNAWMRIATQLMLAAEKYVPDDEGLDVQYIPGNHEARLATFLWRYPALFGLDVLTLEHLLGLEQLGIEYNKDELVLANGELAIRHGSAVGKDSGMSAHAELLMDRFHRATLTGHSHRMGQVFVTTPYGVISGYEMGCLCRDDPEYIKKPNWQKGTAFAYINDEENWFDIQLLPYHKKGKILYTIFEGEYIYA